MKKISIILVFLAIHLSVFSQYSVKVGHENSGSGNFEPCNNQYEYGWSATVYKQSDIQSHGQITDIYYESQLFGGFGPGANTYMFNQRIFMKLVTDNAMTSNAFPDTNQMTLVYAGTVQFLNYQLAQIHLDTPFDLDANHNLMILYINKHGIAQTDNNYFLLFPAEHGQTTNNTVYNNGNGNLPTGPGTYSSDMPVVYLRYASGLDAGISAINNNQIFKLPQQADLTCQIHNYMADTITTTDIEWQLNGTPQTTVNWTGNAYCGLNTPATLQQDFAFAPGTYTIKANTLNPNTGTDELNDNDTTEMTIRVADNLAEAYQNYNDNAIPFMSNRSYGWSVSIYNKDSINLSGQIHSIAYYVTNTNGNTTSSPNQKIYMRTTPNLTNPNTNYPDTNQFVKVFEGSIDYTTVGWHIIKLDTVFDYNNNENLMILYENHAGIATIQAINFKVGWQTTNAIYNYDLNSFPTNSGSTSYQSRVPAVKLYFSIPKDAGVINMANSEVPVFTGNNDFIVDFKNFGTDTLQDVDLKYQVDNGSVGSYHWNGQVNPLNEITDINIGSENFTYGEHLVKIWTENPDFLPDYANGNDTLKISMRACSPMSGTYTVGSTPSDFVSIKAAVDSLNNCGINGAVIFNIKPGTYNGQYFLNQVWGASANNTITFQSETGDSTDVVLTTDSTDFLFYLNGADYISFKHLTFQSDSAMQFVVLDSASNNCSFTGNIFRSDTVLATYVYSSDNFNNNNILINNNLFVKGNISIDLNNETESTSTIQISNNIFDNVKNGIDVFTCNNLTISGNTISVSSGIGIYSNACDNTTISANKVKMQYAKRGICLNSFNVLVTNNFVYGNASGSYNAGIYVTGNWQNTYKYKIVYNSVNLQSGDCAFYVNDADSIWAYNNIFIDKTNEIIRWFSCYLKMDNNCFYTENSVFGSYNGSQNISSLNDWINQTQNDSNSIFALPYFYSNDDLHTNSLIVEGKGIPLSYVTTDIDGEQRDTLTPDIGADEFTSSCNGPLAGTYTIGTTGDYTTFNDAVLALYNCGVDSNVIFNVESGTYNEQVIIDGTYINYVNENDTITFQSQTGNNTDATLTYDADSANNYILKLNNVKNFNLKNLHFQSIDTIYGRIITLEDSILNVNLNGNLLTGVISDTTEDNTACIYYDILATDTFNLNIENNTINNGSYGFKLKTYNTIKPSFSITNNIFNNQNNTAVRLDVNTNNSNNNFFSFTGNEISSSRNPSKGLYLGYFNDSCNISSNKIYLSSNTLNCYGLEIYASLAFVSNNFISIKAMDNNTVYAYHSTWQSKLFNNTFYCYGNEYYFSACVFINSSNTSYIENNCLVNLNAERVIYSDFMNNIQSDYNNLYSHQLNSLVNWQNIYGLDMNSVSFMPDFVSNTDLHTNSALLYQKGTPLPDVTTDIDGEPRNNPPCIGADEFTVPTFNVANDSVFCYYSDQYNNIGSYVFDIGTGYDSYQWSTGSDSSSIVIDTNYAVAGNNQYTVTVTIGSDYYTDTVNIFYDLPNVISQTEYCHWNTPVVVTANPGFVSYEWSTGDTTQSVIFNSGPIWSEITVTDNYGCTAKEAFHVASAYTYSFYGDADINLPDTTICKNQTLVLNALQFSDSNVYNYHSFLWSTGDTTESITVDTSLFNIGNHTIYCDVYLEANQLCKSSDTIDVVIDDCIDVYENNISNISIYPNPASTFIQIESKDAQINSYSIYDIYGRKLKQLKIQNTDFKINIEKLPKGVYFINLQLDNGLIIKKFIKK